jgi:hypothetical protein
MAIAGEVTKVQTVITVLDTAWFAHASRPLATKVLVTLQASNGVVKLPVNEATAPGSRLSLTYTFALGLLPTTSTPLKVISPVFLTVPVKVSTSPGATGFAGQFWVTMIDGLPCRGQVLEELADTACPQELAAVTLKETVTLQTFAGAVNLPVKLATALGAKAGEL